MTFQEILDRIVGDTPEDDAGREKSAGALVENCGYISAAITLIPLPGTELIGIMPVHVGMVVGIARIYGEEITQETAAELVVQIGATVGVSLISSRAATTVAKLLLPGFGGLVGAPLIFVNTLAIGSVARNWFASRGEMSDEEMKAVYKEAAKQAKRDFDPSKVKEARATAEQVARAAREQEAAPAPTAPDPITHEAPAEVIAPEPLEDPAPETAHATEAPADEPAEASEAATAEPEPQQPSSDITARLWRLKSLLELGLIDAEEYAATKQRILSEL